MSGQCWELVGFPVFTEFLLSVGFEVCWCTVQPSAAYLVVHIAMQFTPHSLVRQLCQLFDHSSVYCSGGWSSGQATICPPFVSQTAGHSKVRLVVESFTTT